VPTASHIVQSRNIGDLTARLPLDSENCAVPSGENDREIPTCREPHVPIGGLNALFCPDCGAHRRERCGA
jgi:hypothetical protein